MKDRYGREIEYLRISVTQNCNLKCIYCRPGKDGPCACDCESLTPGDFEKVVRTMAALGIRKVRITGGEPLTRPDICDITGRISKVPGIDDLSMTTNGINLVNKVAALKQAGLKRLNISLDSLKPERYAYITGGGKLKEVLDGIDKALQIGLSPVKINTVLVKGINDGEIDDFIGLAQKMPVEVRFIELMPVGKFGEENPDKIIYNSYIIDTHPELLPCAYESSGQPAQYYTAAGYKGRIGFISPMSHKFCNCCNRIRLTCDGKLKPCLGNNGEVDLLPALRGGPEPDKESLLSDLIEKAIYEKPEGHNFTGDFHSKRGMSAIGG